MSEYKWIIVLIACTIFGFWLRVNQLATIPSELHRDEVAIGYNAYAVLQTGFDEHGAGPYPLIFKSFGDYKLPVMIYLVAISEYFFGLTPLAIRLPNVVAATALIPLTYWLVSNIFSREKYGRDVAAIASILLAIAQWHVFLSRTAYEPILGLTLHIFALAALLQARTKPIFFYLSLLGYAAAFFSYNLPFLLSLLLVPTLLFCFKEDYYSQKNRAHTAVFITMFISLSIGLFGFLSQLTEQKSQATILNNSEIAVLSKDTTNELFIAGLHPRIAGTFANEYLMIGLLFVKNYLASFNPSYLFFLGGENAWHSLRNLGIGNIDPSYILLIIIAVVWQLHKYWQSKEMSHAVLFLFCYTTLSPIIGALTLDAPNTNRLLDLHYALLLWAALGLYWLFHTSHTHFFLKKKLAFGLSIGMLGFFTVRFVLFYFFLHTPLITPEWNLGMQTALHNLSITAQNREYKQIYVHTGGLEQHPPLIAPYIHVALAMQTSPELFRQTVQWSDSVGLVEARSFDVFTFGTDSKSTWEAKSEGAPTAYVTRIKQKDIITDITITQVLYEEQFGLAWVLYELNYK